MTDLVPVSDRPMVLSVGGSPLVPVLVADLGEQAAWRYVEFFTANIRNPNTRRAYARACGRFLAWCGSRGLALPAVRPFHVAAWIEQLQGEVSAPSVKQQLAAVRMLCDWMVIGQVLAAGLLAWLGGLQIDSLPVGGVFGIFVGSTWASLELTLFIVVAVMNMLNFIDGLDGLVAGVGVIANGTFYLYSYMLIRIVDQTNYFNLASLISAIVLGACLGFLPLNWHPAKLFMGDAGALLVGHDRQRDRAGDVILGELGGAADVDQVVEAMGEELRDGSEGAGHGAS